MLTERWFNVLVLGGAAIGLTACGGEAPEGGGGGNGATDAGNGGAGAAASASGGAGNGAQTGGAGSVATGGTSNGGGTSTGGETAAGGEGTGGAIELVCSEDADPGDPCGCPCCWANEGCANDDTTCCEAFCSSGNNGLGCCGG